MPYTHVLTVDVVEAQRLPLSDLYTVRKKLLI